MQCWNLFTCFPASSTGRFYAEVSKSALIWISRPADSEFSIHMTCMFCGNFGVAESDLINTGF